MNDPFIEPLNKQKKVYVKICEIKHGQLVLDFLKVVRRF